MKILFRLKKFLVYIYESLLNNKIVLLLIRKPINTFLLDKFPSKKINFKDSIIWQDQTIYKIDYYKETKLPIQKGFIDYLIKNTSVNNQILDICCNQGRFLKALHNNGYRSLMGVDIMGDAINSLKNSDEYKKGGILVEENLVQEFLTKLENQSIDYAITFTATIELLHPGFNIFKELHRTTRNGFIFLLNENAHSYPRFYRYLIKKNKFRIKNLINFPENLTLIHAEKI